MAPPKRSQVHAMRHAALRRRQRVERLLRHPGCLAATRKRAWRSGTPYNFGAASVKQEFKESTGHGGADGKHAARAVRRPVALVETLLALGVEMRVRSKGWPPATLRQREDTLLSVWADRPADIFADQKISEDIEACFAAAFRNAATDNPTSAAADLHRAYLLVCCAVASARSRRMDEVSASAAPA